MEGKTDQEFESYIIILNMTKKTDAVFIHIFSHDIQ